MFREEDGSGGPLRLRWSSGAVEENRDPAWVNGFIGECVAECEARCSSAAPAEAKGPPCHS